MLAPISLTVPAARGLLSLPLSLLGVDQGSGLSLQLDASASAGDAVALYGGVINSGITSVSQLQKLVELSIPGVSGDGRQPVFAVAPTPFPFIYAVRTAIGTPGTLTLSVSGQETSGGGGGGGGTALKSSTLVVDVPVCHAQPPGASSVTLTAAVPASAKYFSLLIGDVPTPVLFDDPLHSVWRATFSVGVRTDTVEIDVTAPDPLPETLKTNPPLSGEQTGVAGQTFSLTVNATHMAPAQVVGSVNLVTTPGLYGGGGALDGTSFTIIEALGITKFKPVLVAPADAAAVVTKINTTFNGTNFFTDFYMASINGANELVITANNNTDDINLTAGGSDMLTVVGMAPGTYKPILTPSDITTATQGLISAELLFF